MTWKKIIKSNWREQARGDLETPAELIILQQSLFYMEELLKMMKPPAPNIPDMIEFLEYNIKTVRGELD